MRARILVLALLAANGCAEERRCAEGYMFDEGAPDELRCVPLVDAGATDAARPDAAPDARVDAGTDAGPCGMTCAAPTPVCDEAGRTCVECLERADCAGVVGRPACVGTACVACEGDADCGGATSRCETSSATCVECLDAADCTSAMASQCSANACAPCELDPHCAHLAATPVCDEARGTCAACTADTEAARCGAFSCRTSDGTCTETTRGSQDTCDPCEADSECITGRRCVRHVFAGTDVGAFCFRDSSMGGCGDTDATRRPYSTRTELTSVGGVTAIYCMPPVATTCRGIADTRSAACTTSDECGVPALADGYCPTGGSGAGLCSYACGGAVDCRDTLNCGGDPAHCRP